MKQLLGLLVLLIADSNCENVDKAQSADTKIVGGILAQPGQYPFQVSLKTPNGIHFCGGTLITINHVLTAGHCIYQDNGQSIIQLKPKDLFVYAGSTKLTMSGVTRSVLKITVHSSYSSKTLQNDIAILKLSAPYNMTNAIRTISLRSSSLNQNENCTVSGWGYTFQGGYVVDDLRVVAIPIYNQGVCKRVYVDNKGNTLITDDMVCAGFAAGSKDSCQGDSGGPLVCAGAISGVVSFGNGCALPNYPGVYTNVYKYRSWIQKIINGAQQTASAYLSLFIFVQFITILLK